MMFLEISQVLTCEFCEISKNTFFTTLDDCFCLFELANVRNIQQEKIKNFVNVIEFLLLKALFYKLWK